MNRWGNFFLFFCPRHLPLACQGLPGLCNLSVSTSFCKADSIKITPVAESESDRGQFDWLCAFCFFSAQVTALPAIYGRLGINCLCPNKLRSKRPLWLTCLKSWVNILLADRLWHDRCPQHVCVCPFPLIGHISAFIGQCGTGAR